jgi:hypothetical protein
MYVNTPLKDIDNSLNIFILKHTKKINKHSNKLIVEITYINI